MTHSVTAGYSESNRRAPSVEVIDCVDMLPRISIRATADAEIIVRALAENWRTQVAGRMDATDAYTHGAVFDLLCDVATEAARVGVDITRHVPDEITEIVDRNLTPED